MKYQGKIQDPLDLVTKQYVDNREVTESTVSDWGFTKNTGTVTTTGTMTNNHVVVSNGTTVVKDSGFTIEKSVPSDAVFTDTTYESKTATSGGTDVSLVTTGEKYNWNNKGSYSKPSGGIPKTDLASAVQTSLERADSAVQPETGKGLFSGSYNDLTNKPTIPTVPTNVSAFTNDAGYLTQHQSLSAYRTASAQDTIDSKKASLDANNKVTPAQASSRLLSVTAATTLALTHAGCCVYTNSSSSITITIPANSSVAFPVGTEIEVMRYGSGAAIVKGASGVYLYYPGGGGSAGSATISDRYGVIAIKKMSTNTWVASGCIA